MSKDREELAIFPGLHCTDEAAACGQEEYDREKERVMRKREASRQAEKEQTNRRSRRTKRRNVLSAVSQGSAHGGTPRVHRSIEQEILAALDVERERMTLQGMQMFRKQTSTWDRSHDDALGEHTWQTHAHRNLAETLKTAALHEMRSKKSLGAQETDFAKTDQEYNKLLLAYQMTPFENCLHEYRTCNENLQVTRKKFIGFPPRPTEYWMEKLPATLSEVNDRYYEWRRPELVEELKSMQLYDIETLDSPPHAPKHQDETHEEHLADAAHEKPATPPKHLFLGEESHRISPTGELGSSHNIFPLPSKEETHILPKCDERLDPSAPAAKPAPANLQVLAQGAGPVAKMRGPGAILQQSTVKAISSVKPDDRSPSPQKSWGTISPRAAAQWEREQRWICPACGFCICSKNPQFERCIV